MSTISHAGPPCLASDDDKHVPVRCTLDRGHPRGGSGMSTVALVEPRGTFAPGDINFHTAEAVRWLIRREDQQQNHVAIAAGIDPEELSRYMTGREPFSVAALMLIAEALCVSPAYLMALASAFHDGGDPEGMLFP